MRIEAMGTKCFVLLLSLFCLGWADNWGQIRTAAGAITTVESHFVQEVHLPILSQPLVSKGVFYYKAPRSLRWEYQWPVRSIMIVGDGGVKRFVASGDSGFHQEKGAGLEAMDVVVQEITYWLAGRFDKDPLFTAQLEPGKSIVLVPKSGAFQKVIERIVLEPGSRPGVMKSVTIYESNHAFTRLIFHDTVLNGAIKDALFKKSP